MQLAVDTIEGTEMASLSVVHRGQIVETPAATSEDMERYGLDAVRSFAALKRISQESNVPMHQVATDLIRTRILIGGPDDA